MSSLQIYSLVLRHLHWIGGFVFILAFILGQIFDEAEGGAGASQAFFFHASVGLAALGLVALRLLERIRSSAPASLDTHTALEKKLSRLVQWGLYGGMVALPVTGVLMVWTKGFSVPFFTLFELPSLTGKNNFLHEVIEELHEGMIPVMVVLLALHVAGALKHHFWDKDTTLSRMNPFDRR